MKQKINIGIVEDHELVRKGFVSLLSAFKNIHILFEANNGTELLKKLKTFAPDIILLDIEMPELGGLQAMLEIKRLYPSIKIIVISAYDDDEDILEYANKGASSFLPKNCNIEDLTTTIQGVYKNGLYFHDNKLKEIASQSNFKTRQLTEKEMQLIQLLYHERSQQDISTTLGININAISGHKYRLFRKTNTKDVKELIAYAQRNNYLG